MRNIATTVVPCVLTALGVRPSIVGAAGTKPSLPCTSTRSRTEPLAVVSSSAWSNSKAKRSVLPAARVLVVIVPSNCDGPPRSRWM